MRKRAGHGGWWLAALALLLPVGVDACTKRLRWELQPPYGTLDATGARTGYYIEVAREALARLGCRAVIVEMPWARGLRELEQGRLDLLPGAISTPERSRYARFSRPVNLSPNLLFLTAAAARRHPLRSLGEVRGTDLRIAMEAGAHYSDEYAGLLGDPAFRSRLHAVPDRQRAWRMLASGRLDGLISDQGSALVAGVPFQSGPEDIRPALVLSAQPARIAFSRLTTDADFLRRFDRALESMIEDGSLLRLREHYIPCPVDPETLGCRVGREGGPP